MRGGAGGGYSGGSGLTSTAIQDTGYGGGSYNGGYSQSNFANYWLGNGRVTITYAYDPAGTLIAINGDIKNVCTIQK